MKKIKGIAKELFKIDYPDIIKTRKAKIIYWINWHLSLRDQGTGLIMRFFSSSQELMLALLVIDRFFPGKINTLGVVLAVIGITIFFWFIGVIKIYYQIDKIENTIALVRNPFQKDLHKLVSKNNKDKL